MCTERGLYKLTGLSLSSRLKFIVIKVQHRVAPHNSPPPLPLPLFRNEEVPAAQKRIFPCLCDNRSADSILSLLPPWRQITARMVSTKLVAALVAWHASHQNSRGNTAKPENAQPTVHAGGGGMSLTTAVITSCDHQKVPERPNFLFKNQVDFQLLVIKYVQMP